MSRGIWGPFIYYRRGRTGQKWNGPYPKHHRDTSVPLLKWNSVLELSQTDIFHMKCPIELQTRALVLLLPPPRIKWQVPRLIKTQERYRLASDFPPFSLELPPLISIDVSHPCRQLSVWVPFLKSECFVEWVRVLRIDLRAYLLQYNLVFTLLIPLFGMILLGLHYFYSA